MPAPTTPTPASSSSLVQASNDTSLQTYAQVFPTSTTAFITSVNQTGEALFGRPIIFTTKYSVASVALSTYALTMASTSNQVTVSTVRSSAPIVLTSVTQYHRVVASNTTVFNAQNSPSSLLQTAGQSDVVSFKNVVIADTEA